MSLRMFLRVVLLCALLPLAKAIVGAAPCAQTILPTSNPVADTDPIYPVLVEWKAALEKRYAQGGCVLPVFGDWGSVQSPEAAKLFPNLRFASISWSETSLPGAKDRALGLALFLGTTVAVNPATKSLVTTLSQSGNYESFGKLLVDYRAPLRDTADAARIWGAFCDVHRHAWKDLSLEQVSESEWHLGIYRYDQTISVEDGVKTAVTKTHFMRVLVDPETHCVSSWEAKVETSNERKTRTS